MSLGGERADWLDVAGPMDDGRLAALISFLPRSLAPSPPNNLDWREKSLSQRDRRGTGLREMFRLTPPLRSKSMLPKSFALCM